MQTTTTTNTKTTETGAGAQPIAEIVTFQLKKDAETKAFLDAATMMDLFLKGTGAVLARTLSKDPQGVWTDHIIWTSLQAAKDGAAAVMQDPGAAPFMSMIDETTVTMGHAEISHRMD